MITKSFTTIDVIVLVFIIKIATLKNSVQDVKLQMDAKLWGEEFNRHNPPKKVNLYFYLFPYFI